MSLSYRISAHSAQLCSHYRFGFNEFPAMARISTVCTPFDLRKSANCVVNHRNYQSLYSTNPVNNAGGLSDDQNRSPDNEGSMGKTESSQKEAFSSNELLKKLRRYGISGILSYGLLNTAYYLTTFLLVWFYVAPAPGRIGYVAAVERFLKIMAMVWVGSQVTKLPRAGGALALAPLVDRGLSWFTVKFKLESEGKAFMVIVGFCFGLALILFFAITLLWA